ncbi:DUF362 domain-containing protein [Candidatus Bathyarchaeota archaeon]|nr:DUF362 domain-containing protein [Candidatus Bathyarchaeota archaeon]
MPQVAIVKGERGLEPVYRALDLLGYEKRFQSTKTVLIKVNFITTKNWATGATTDPMVVEGIVDKLRAINIEPIVVESDATGTNADKALVTSGMKDLCDRRDIEWINLRHAPDKVEIPIPDGEVLKNIRVPRIVLDYPIISAAKLKTHSQTDVTLGMKNMFGLLPEKFKGKYHFMGIDKVIVDINKVLKPALTVIDGFVGMEGRGPVHGNPVKMDLIIAGFDPVATDATAARIMGFDPNYISHIRMANQKNLGTIENIEELGEAVEKVKRQFMKP